MRCLSAALLACLAVWSGTLHACPFCDAGSTETAVFVVLMFGAFAAAAFFIFLACKRKGVFRDDLKPEMGLLEAEHIHSHKGNAHDRNRSS